MKIIILYSFFLFIHQLASAQQKIDTILKNRLDKIMIKDQKYRSLMDFDSSRRDSLAKKFGVSSDSLNQYLWSLQNNLDSTNWTEVENIFQKCGYPGKTLVGNPTDEVAWYILQHNLPKIKKYFPLIANCGG